MISDTALYSMKYLDAVVVLKAHGIKRGTIEIGPDNPHILYASVPRKYTRLAARLFTGMIPGGTFVIEPLPWWKCRIKKFDFKIVVDSRSVKG